MNGFDFIDITMKSKLLVNIFFMLKQPLLHQQKLIVSELDKHFNRLLDLTFDYKI